MKTRFLSKARLLAAVLTLAGTWAIAIPSSYGQTPDTAILQRQSTLRPSVNEYPVVLEAGQTITIRMSSDDFDTVLILLGPDGEEVAFNDDSEGTLNSRIIYTVPETGEYTVVTRAFGSGGGVYNLQVQPSTQYEVLIYDAEVAYFVDNDVPAAISALSAAIELDPSQPNAYVQRGHMQFQVGYMTLDAAGLPFDGPLSLPLSTREAIARDFLAAANLYEASGDAFQAESLRMEAEFIQTGEYPPFPESEHSH